MGTIMSENVGNDKAKIEILILQKNNWPERGSSLNPLDNEVRVLPLYQTVLHGEMQFVEKILLP